MRYLKETRSRSRNREEKKHRMILFDVAVHVFMLYSERAQQKSVEKKTDLKRESIEKLNF